MNPVKTPVFALDIFTLAGIVYESLTGISALKQPFVTITPEEVEPKLYTIQHEGKAVTDSWEEALQLCIMNLEKAIQRAINVTDSVYVVIEMKESDPFYDAFTVYITGRGPVLYVDTFRLLADRIRLEAEK